MRMTDTMGCCGKLSLSLYLLSSWLQTVQETCGMFVSGEVGIVKDV